ncbi:MAG: hypothetical protein K2J99_15515 [Lachnospiraceae bacterium]|nr:hypothetical protein [Lachnospiraceae bacterium]
MMGNLEIISFFSAEDREFNREMVVRSMNQEKSIIMPERRGGKMLMDDLFKRSMYQDRQYDFTSEILDEYRKKWGITE